MTRGAQSRDAAVALDLYLKPPVAENIATPPGVAVERVTPAAIAAAATATATAVADEPVIGATR